VLAGGRLSQTKKTFGGLVARLRLLAPCLGRGVEELTNEVATAENDLDIPAVDLIDALAMAVTARDWCEGGAS
jgi:hypothetical protein